MNAEETILMPGLKARMTGRGILAVHILPEADPESLTPQVLDGQHAKLGSMPVLDGKGNRIGWVPSWKFRKEYFGDFSAQAGLPAFDPQALDAQEQHLRDPACRMDLDEKGRLVETPTGRLKVWMKPDAAPPTMPDGADSVIRSCGIGIDVAEGVEATDSVLEVFFADTREQAAELADFRITPPELGRFAAAVARFYNEALVLCVRPMHGITVLRTMADECNYNFLWHQHITTRIVERATKNLGWAKGELSSPALIDPWADDLKAGRAVMHSALALTEHRQCVFDERGRIVLQERALMPPDLRLRHADCVVACAGAARACRDLPAIRAVIRTAKTMYDLERARREAEAADIWRRGR